MDAGRNKPQAEVLLTTPMDIGNIPQYPVMTSRSATFNTRNVTREDNLPCKLTVYLECDHGFVRLENKEREIDIVRGLYPARSVRRTLQREGRNNGLLDGLLDYLFYAEVPPVDPSPEHEKPDPIDEVPVHRVAHNQCPVEQIRDFGRARRFLPASAVSGGVRLAGSTLRERASWGIGVGTYYLYQSLTEKKQGVVADEAVLYRHYYRTDINHIPKVTFFISQQEALGIEKHISEYDDACNKGEESCSFRTFGFNCVDFAQEVFSKTGYPGHFIQYFTPSDLNQGVACQATLYAASYHPVVKNTASLGGTLMLATVVGKYVVPKLTESARTVGSWMCGWVWPEQQAVATTQVDESQLKQLHNSVQSSNLSCETFWENHKQRDAKAKQLISDSVDLQARFYDVDTLIKRKGYNGSHQSYIFQELQSIQDGFTEFFRQAADMKNA
ncbi:hypothetical protein [Endozoicomonas sp. 4G]|uniref:hypothetical protein n=1 Tax=Endozoicomonas sp. 4G TaxID=2872754 RepID=UPI00207855E1|nr:hypothetical protein [Endozoicomonas sp. 4G]